nr:vesicle-associated membrane protein-associated protein c16g5.05c [Quercus suber]
MSVELEPAELGFKRPFTHEVSQVLRLRNTNADPVAFKVKTTAPKQYCVRPNSGRIEPGQDVEVQVLLQAMKEDPPLDTRCKDKFLVQSVAVPADQEGSVSQIWTTIEQTAKSSIQEKKIRVSFLPADGSGNTLGVAGANVSSLNDNPPAYSSPSPSAATPQRSAATPRSVTGDDSHVFGDTTETSAQQSTIGAAAAAVSNSLPSGDDMRRQLDAARAQIAQLQQQASEGLRQRKVTSNSSEKGTTSTSLQNAPAPGGVSVQITALLCLLSFIIAYLFF